MKPLRFGLISTSSIAPRFLAALRQSGAGEARALYSRGEQKAKESAAAWGIPLATSSLEELLAMKELDAVYISSVNTAHYLQAKAALEAGKHVLCEKPCTVEPSHTKELFSLARAKGKLFMEAQKMLFLPAVQEAKRRIDGGWLGEVSHVVASHSFSPGYNGWMFDPKLSGLGGGPLASSGIYATELLLYLLGEIRSIHGSFTYDGEGRMRQYVLSGLCKEQIPFALHNSTLCSLENRAVIYGTKGSLELKNYWKADTLLGKGEEDFTLSYPCSHELVYEICHFAECAAKGLSESPVVTEALSVAGLEALQRAQKQ